MDGHASAAANGHSPAELGRIFKNLCPRWFLMRDVHSAVGTLLLQPRWAMSVLREPMTRSEIQRARVMREGGAGAAVMLARPSACLEPGKRAAELAKAACAKSCATGPVPGIGVTVELDAEDEPLVADDDRHLHPIAE